MSLLNKYSKNPFLRNVAVMFSGNGLALVIPFFMAPFISRVYTPEDFAAFELIVKILTFIAALGSLRYELAIVISKTNEDSQLITRLCFFILFIMTGLSVILVLFKEEVGAALNNTNMIELMWLVPIGVFVVGAYALLVQVVIRLEEFKVLAGNKIIASASNHLSKYGLGLINPVPFGLVVGQILGSLVPLVMLFRRGPIRAWMAEMIKRAGSIKEIAGRYKDYPLFNGSHTLYDHLYHFSLFSLISIGYGEVVLGLFAYAFRYLRIPVQVVGSSLSQVLMPRVSRMKDKGEPLRMTITKSMASFLLIGLLPFSALFFYGQEIFAFIFGDNWAFAGRYAEIMAPWLLLNFAVSPVSFLPAVLKKQRGFLIINIVFGLLTLGAVFLLYSMSYEFENILYALTYGNVLLNIFLFFWFLNIADHGAMETSEDSFQ